MQNSLPSVKNRALGKDLLCRVLHSAKNCTRQRFLCRVPGTRQTRALGKGLLCRVPDSRQNLYARHRLPVKRRRVTAFFAERQPSGTRQRFVFFVFNFFAECPRSGTRQRFIFIFLKFFAERLRSGARQRKFFYF